MSWKASLSNKSVIEHPKPGGSLRWRKRMGHLFQLVRWKRSNKAEGVKASCFGSKWQFVPKVVPSSNYQPKGPLQLGPQWSGQNVST
ncbi:hypothetical protein Gogos_008582 [Gossypium gossypioides]|uniref:Uncharacterized protein n=1 Tax=Gossypium gossypioides TaxID=34282 RepID=A0A7J9CCL3_GOSGO|nr:hypothetical protein [Gossypium gossypioides]